VGAWRRLGAAGGKGGGQRRRRRRGEFGLNTGIFSPKHFIFWCVQVVSYRRAVWLLRKKMVTCFPPLQPAQWQRSGSAVEAQWKRSGCAADAQRPGLNHSRMCTWTAIVPLLGGGEFWRGRFFRRNRLKRRSEFWETPGKTCKSSSYVQFPFHSRLLTKIRVPPYAGTN
jgi:hypothetical protein